MSATGRSFFLGLLVWQGCLVAAAVTIWMGSEVDASVLIPSMLAGVLVAGTVALKIGRLKKGGAAVAGFAIGLVPSAAGLLWGLLFASKGIDAAAGWMALSLWLSVPSAIGGALCGLVCSRLQHKT